MVAAPLYMTPVPAADVKRGDGRVVTEFVQSYCRVTKASWGGSAGSLIDLRQWQQNAIAAVYARRPDKRLRHRQALIGLPRKNGKSALGSSMGLYGLITGDDGSEVYSAAVDKEQARVVFNVAKRMVELDPELDDRQGGILRIQRDSILYPEKNSIYKVLSSEAITKEGLNPTVVIYDELHGAPDPELYDVMTLAMGARIDPLLIAITTAGTKSDKTGHDSVCYKLYQRGVKICQDAAVGKNDDESFFRAWWGAPDGADFRDPEVWAAANPGLGDILDPEQLSFALNSVHENEFRTKHLNQWVSAVHAWLPQGAWEACGSNREFTPGKRGVVLGFDGSKSQDTTALVAVTIDAEPQIIVIGVWEKPDPKIDPDWRVPRGEVKDAIRRACQDYNVREVACDEYIWTDALEELADEGIPIAVFSQTLSHIAPATQRMYEMVTNKKVSHDRNPTMARHFENCQLKTDSRGSKLAKDSKSSPRKIDLAMATVMAVDRAGFFLHQPLEGTINGMAVSEVQFVWGDGPAGGSVSIGESCARCGNRIVRQLKRIGIQVVCAEPCSGTVPEPEPPKDDGFYHGYMVT